MSARRAVFALTIALISLGIAPAAGADGTREVELVAPAEVLGVCTAALGGRCGQFVRRLACVVRRQARPDVVAGRSGGGLRPPPER
jgi:hypothetical protein